MMSVALIVSTLGKLFGLPQDGCVHPPYIMLYSVAITPMAHGLPDAFLNIKDLCGKEVPFTPQ